MNGLKMRGKVFYVQAHNPQKNAQDEISLRTKKRSEALTLRNRFLTTLAETKSWENARFQLLGKKALRKGESPDFETMKDLFTAFNEHSHKKIRPNSFATAVNSLKRLMDRMKAKTVANIDLDNFTCPEESKKTMSGEIRASRGIFKPAALRYYETRGVKIVYPFLGADLESLNVTPYTALPKSVRASILNGIADLPKDQALALILCLKLGLRKSEADKARMSWFREDTDGNFLFTVRKEDDFTPKTAHSVRSIPIPTALVEEIKQARAEGEAQGFDPYIVFGGGRGKVRKDKTYRALNEWLKAKGVEAKQPLHSMRKEWVSHVCKHHGIVVAQKLAGHADMNLTMKVYGGLTGRHVIDFK